MLAEYEPQHYPWPLTLRSDNPSYDPPTPTSEAWIYHATYQDGQLTIIATAYVNWDNLTCGFILTFSSQNGGRQIQWINPPTKLFTHHSLRTETLDGSEQTTPTPPFYRFTC
jgi:hypothetical protein